MTTSLSETVAAEVRAELARQKVTGKTLAAHLHVSHAYVSRRLTGAAPFDVDDLEQICQLLNVAPTRFLVAAV
jgi:transcriptional regulator with XRE-family HTH domain